MKTKITIKGRRVQDVGYRLFLLSKAHNLKGFEATNVGEDLLILIERDDATAAFKHSAKRLPTFCEEKE